MTEFCVKLAGISIGIKAVYESTGSFCKDYLTEEAPLFSVTIDGQCIDRIRETDIATAISEGRTPIDHSDSYLEQLALCHEALEELIDYSVIMMHGVALAVGDRAYIFSANSGTGKTTHARLWLKNIPDCHILNGDKPLLRFTDNGVYVCGSPWRGKERYGINETLPLAGFCALERGSENRIEKLNFKAGFDILLNRCHIPEGSGKLIKVIKLLNGFKNVNMYRLSCNMEDEAAFVSYNALTGRQQLP